MNLARKLVENILISKGVKFQSGFKVNLICFACGTITITSDYIDISICKNEVIERKHGKSNIIDMNEEAIKLVSEIKLNLDKIGVCK